MKTTAQTILIIGGPASGKTHYGGQLYGRLRNKNHRWELSSTPEDLSIFAEVLSKLENGQSAGHTATSTWLDVRMNLCSKEGQTMSITWPEYGGEQIDEILRTRRISSHWLERIRQAKGWLLFLRLHKTRLYETVFDRHLPEGEMEPRIQAAGWDTNAQIVELLQMFLEAAKQSVVKPISSPRMAVLLSCWDELPSQEKPLDVFQSKMPLIASFVEANWQKDAWSVWGLSSLEKPLVDGKSDDEYVDRGPDKFGYVIAPSNDERNRDLTLPLDWLSSL